MGHRAPTGLQGAPIHNSPVFVIPVLTPAFRSDPSARAAAAPTELGLHSPLLAAPQHSKILADWIKTSSIGFITILC